jgi:hypothetical protein
MRPTAPYPVKKLIQLTREQAEAIADYRFSRRIYSENEAIRRLIDLGLKQIAEEQRGAEKPKDDGE